MSKSSTIMMSAIVFGGIGFASGYYFSKNKYCKIADKEIESMKKVQKEHDQWLKDFYTKPTKEKEPIANDKPLISTVTPKRVGKNDRLEYEKKYRGVKNDELETEESENKFGKIIENYAPTDEDDNQEDPNKKLIHDLPKEKENKDEKLELDVLSVDEFDSSSNCCSTLYYYEKDCKVTDVDNNIISHYIDLIGPMDFWFKVFADQKSDVIYIRNNKNEVDYEVVLLHEKWEDVASPAQKALALNIGEQVDDN